MASEELLAPPSWEDIEKDEGYQALAPAAKAETLTNWAKDIRGYGESQGWWSDQATQDEFKTSTQTKLQEIQALDKSEQPGFFENFANELESNIGNFAASVARGATSEGIQMGAEGLYRMASDVVQSDFAPVAGAIMGVPSALTVNPEAKRETAENLQFIAGEAGRQREAVREALPVSEEYQQTLSGQVAQGIGQLANIPAYAVPGLGPATSIAQLYQEGYDDAIQNGASPEVAASAARKYAAVAGPIDIIADKLLVGKALKALEGKTTIKAALSEIGKQAVQQGGSEGAQQVWLNAVAKELEGYDPNRTLTQDVVQSALVGGLVGIGGATLAQAAGILSAPKAENRAIVEQAAVQSENLRSNNAPATADAVEQIAAEEVVENSVQTDEEARAETEALRKLEESPFEPEDRMAEAVSELTAGEDIFLPEQGDERFAPKPNLEGTIPTKPTASDEKSVSQLRKWQNQALGLPDGAVVEGQDGRIYRIHENSKGQKEILVQQEDDGVWSVQWREGQNRGGIAVLSDGNIIGSVFSYPPGHNFTSINTAAEQVQAQQPAQQGAGTKVESTAVEQTVNAPTQATPQQQQGQQAGPEGQTLPTGETVGTETQSEIRTIAPQQREPIVPTEEQASGSLSVGQENNISLGNLKRVEQGLPISQASQSDLLTQGFATIQGGQLSITPQGAQLLQTQSNVPSDTATQPEPSGPQGTAGVPQTTEQPEVPRRIQLRGTPAVFQVIEAIPPTPAEQERGESYFRVRNEKTGEEQTVEANDIARDVKPKSERVQKVIKKLPKNQQAKAEAATEISTEPDPYQGTPLSSASPLTIEENLDLLEELSRYGILDEGATGQTVLQKIVNNKSEPEWMRTLARRLLALNLQTTAEAQYRPDSTWAALKAGNRNIFNLARRSPGVAASILHEEAHQATLDIIRQGIADPDSLTKTQREAFDGLQGILSEIQALPEFQGEYGITNIEELVAEAFSNAGFRAKLENLNPNQPPSSLWRRFIRWIAQLLTGTKVQSGSALERAVEAAFTLAGAPIIETKGIAASIPSISYEIESSYASALNSGNFEEAQRLADSIFPELPDISKELQEEINSRLESLHDEGEIVSTGQIIRELIEEIPEKESIGREFKKELEDIQIKSGVVRPYTEDQLKEVVSTGRKKYDFKRGNNFYVFNSWSQLGGFQEDTYKSDQIPFRLSERLGDSVAAMAEPIGWGDVLANNKNASNEAMAKAYEEAAQELENTQEVTREDTEPLTVEQQGYLAALGDQAMQIVRGLARKFSNIPGTDFDDRVDEGIQGLIKAAKSYNPEIGNFAGWANRVVSQQLLNYRRNKLREAGIMQSGNRPVFDEESTEDVISITPSPEDLTIQENDLRDLRLKAGEAIVAAINSLPERDQNILRDYASGMNLREVGARNNISHEGAKKVIVRSRQAIEKALFLRGIENIDELLTEPQERYGAAEPTRALRPEDEQEFQETTVGNLESNDLGDRGAISDQENPELSTIVEGIEENTRTGVEEWMEFSPFDGGVYATAARGGGQGGENQSAPVERRLSEIITDRPALAGYLDRLESGFQKIGVSTALWNNRSVEAGDVALGKVQIRIDPTIFDGEPDGFVRQAIEEEAIHAIDILSQHQRYVNSGSKLSSGAWMEYESRKLIENLATAIYGLPAAEKAQMEEAVTAAYNLYNLDYSKPAAADINEVFRQVFNPEEGAVLNIDRFVHELARMVVQKERSGQITEETSNRFLKIIRDWLVKSAQAIKNAARIITQGGLKDTEFGKFTTDLLNIFNNTIPPEGLIDARPSIGSMAQSRPQIPQIGPEDTTSSDDASVAPMSPRGRETRTPILPPELRDKLRKNTEGPYRAQGLFSAAGKWSQGLYDLLKQKNQSTRAALSRVEFIGNKLNSQINKEFVKEGIPVPTEQLNTALGNTDNRLTKDQADEANRITDEEERAAFILTAKTENLEKFKKRQQAALDGLPSPIRDTILEMRELIDDLSKKLISEGALSDDLRGAVDDNVGTYLHRSYRIFDGDEWNDFIRSDDPEATAIRNRAENLFTQYIRAQKAVQYGRDMRAEGTPVSRSEALAAVQDLNVSQEVETMLNDYLAVADGSVVDTLRGRLPGQKNQSILKVRGDIPKEIRDLWGQYDDASVNFAKTYASIATFLENNRFLQGVLKDGLENGYLWKEGVSQGVRPPGYVQIVGEEGAKSLAPLAGTWGPPVLRDAFQETFSPQVRDWLGTLTMAAMKAKTVYSIGSIVRNFLGNPAFMLANGNLFTGGIGNAASQTIANWRKMGTKEQRERIARYTELGILGENIGPQIIKELSEGSKILSEAKTPFQALLKWTGERLSGVREGFEKTYSGVDDFWKIYAFESELAKQKWANPDMPTEQAEQKAAQIVRSTVPTYSESPAVVRDLLKGKVGKFVAPFITFTTEVMRVTGGSIAQTAQELQSDNPREKAIGAARLAGMITVATLPAMISQASKYIFGYDDEDEEALRAALPEWQKNATLVFLPRDKDGNIRFIDLSYLNPYNYFTDAAKAIGRSIDRGDSSAQVALNGIKGAAKQLLDPFLSEQIAIGAYVDIARNQKANGAEVYNPQDTTGVKAQKIAGRILQSFTPGTVDSAFRVGKAATGYIEPTGRSYDLGNEIAAPLLGQRISSYNPRQGLQFQTSRFNGERQDAAQVFSRVFNSQGTVDQGQVADAYNRANEARYRIYQNMRNNYLGALALGLSREDAIRTMKAKNAGDEAISQVVKGQYLKYRPSDSMIKDVARQFPERVTELQQAYNETPVLTPFSR